MANFVNSVDEFFEFCKDNDVGFVDFRYTDLRGVWHHVTYRMSAVDKELLENGLPFDGSSTPKWQPINQSDMLLKPDIPTAFLDPFTADPTIIVFCDVYDIYKNEMYEKCPRSIAKATMRYAESLGIADAAYFGPENEFFVFDDIKFVDHMNEAGYKIDTEEGAWNSNTSYKDGYNTGHRAGPKGGYTQISPVDTMVDLRAEMMQVLEQVGLEVILAHSEVAQGQGEIGIVYSDMISAADNIQKLKYVVKMVAHLNGKTATFMPKPLFGDNGNGMHVHQSLWKDGRNLFYQKGEYANLSKMALNYIGGIFHHAKAVAALTNPTTNSYKRLLPGFEAPNILTYSMQNRTASCRIPYGAGEKSTRVEMRFPDSSACPYLAFSALMMAGLDGIKNEYIPAGPMDENLYKLTLDEIREKGIVQLPHTLREATEALIADNDFLKPVFTPQFIKSYQHLMFENQIWPDESRPTAYEFKTTYSC
ncbi:MAG: type I glutamate--ammonia ligase [Sulfurimonas sp.]|jgi:glutamine synthetase|nr:type I glutamate--ammonia ligase [Sulfurimonadaceae bacterium]